MSVLAFDLGASGGKAFVGRLTDGRLEVEEIHRFPNDPVQVGKHLYWDILRIFHHIKQGVIKSKQLGHHDIQSIGIDSWACDFGLIGKNGELLGNPYHYRDHQSDGMIEEVTSILSRQEIFSRTGIQFMPLNTLYHLYAMTKAECPILGHAEALLQIPDLLNYFLTGEQYSEFTNSSTTQIFNPLKKQWDDDLLRTFHFPAHIFRELVQPGTIVGKFLPSVCVELGTDAMLVVAVASHDTASAVVAVPSEQKDFVYISSGTWSLLGTELDEPILNAQALEWNFTNEGGVKDTFRFLKNIMGLWLVQECKRIWEMDGRNYSYEQLVDEARQAVSFRSFIDPDHLMFYNPVHMPKQIQQYCRDTNQPAPESVGQIIRCILESLAMKYCFFLEKTETLAQKKFSVLHMVGGSIQNTMLCQLTANAIGRPVLAGPVEATAIGNIIVQLMAMGEIASLEEGRSLIKKSFPSVVYEPEEQWVWHEQYKEFQERIK